MLALMLPCLVTGLSTEAGYSQDTPDLTPEEAVTPWTFAGSDNSFGGSEVGGQNTRVLSITPSIWLRRLDGGRKLGLRLRLTGIIGFTDFERLEEFDLESVRLGGLIPGIEFLIPLSSRSMLRPWADVGLGLTNTEIDNLLLAIVGIRGEFVFPWKRWELGLEPRLQATTSDANRELFDGSYIVLGLKADARYPLGFRIGGQVPDIGVYFEPGWFPDGLTFESVSGREESVDEQFEVGVTLGFRYLAPKLWFVRIPRLGVGYRFGDGLSGLRIRIGGDRVTRLPLP